MRELSSRLRHVVRRHQKTKPQVRAAASPRWRPSFELLEDRLTPATAGFLATSPAVLSGLVYLNPANTGVFHTGDTLVPGATVTLTGTSTQGTAVNTSVTSDANGAFSFFQVQPGKYSLTANTGNF